MPVSYTHLDVYKRQLKTRLTLLTVGIFVVGIWLLAFYASRILREDLQQMLGEQQFAAVSVMAQEINDHLSDRLQAVESIAKQVTPAVLADAVALQTLLEPVSYTHLDVYKRQG